jgi:hypothetical protein
MMRILASNLCPTCGGAPEVTGGGAKCSSCGQTLKRLFKGVVGDEEDEALLRRYGFERAIDVGDIYYLRHGAPLIQLFADGTWSHSGEVDPEAAGQGLEDFLKLITNPSEQ